MPIQIATTEVSTSAIIAEMRKKKIWYDGHYILRCGEHTDVFIYTRRANEIFTLHKQILHTMHEFGHPPEHFFHIGLQHSATRILRTLFKIFRGYHFQFLYPDTESGALTFNEKQLAILQNGMPVLIHDDVMRKGRAVKKLVDLCLKHGINVHSIVTAINVGLPQIQGIPIRSLVEYPIMQWDPNKCGLCNDGIPSYDPYHFTRF